MIHLVPDCIDEKAIHHGSLIFKQRVRFCLFFSFFFLLTREDNISAFIEVCELTLKFDSNLVFVTADLFEEKNLAKVRCGGISLLSFFLTFFLSYFIILGWGCFAPSGWIALFCIMTEFPSASLSASPSSHSQVAATIAEVQKLFRPSEWKVSNQVATQKGMEQADAEVYEIDTHCCECYFFVFVCFYFFDVMCVARERDGNHLFFIFFVT
jgi:hypothetical protein